jgi:NADH-quinone oxidoreductase subunit L
MIVLFYVILMTPLASLIISFLFSNKNEKAIFLTSLISVIVNYIALAILGTLWVIGGFENIYLEGPVLYQAADVDFTISVFVDGYGLVYLMTATFLTGIIVIFSKNYVHREKGYKRFFNNIKFFYLGLLIVLLSGNLETLFLGWEIIGVTSFFLIGFYRDRYLPVKNAMKVVSLYRVADIALILGLWLSHHYFGYSINFNDLDGIHSNHLHLESEAFYQYAIPFLFLIAAMVKSAQFPFSSWLPRAMEGPTTSSSIFYGSLSAHIGVFLLIRTSPFWEGNYWFHFIIGGIGLTTIILSTLTARVQSTIKTQIAYSSLAQIGLMFVEISVGLYWLAIIHFVGNALLRSHQLLISPSILSYKIHNQFFHFNPPNPQGTKTFWERFKLSLYILSVKEFNMDTFMYNYLWNPLKKAGNFFRFLSVRNAFIIGLVIFSLGLIAEYEIDLIPFKISQFMPILFSSLGLILILKAFVDRKNAMNAWLLLLINQLYLSLAFTFNDKFDLAQISVYLSGIVVCGLIGIWVIQKLKRQGKEISLNQFNGLSYEHPRLAFLFIVACLGVAGFPISPTFIGVDLMLAHIHENQFFLLLFIILNLVLDGLVIFRLYSRLFLGQHKKGYHEFAYRSS